MKYLKQNYKKTKNSRIEKKTYQANATEVTTRVGSVAKISMQKSVNRTKKNIYLEG